MDVTTTAKAAPPSKVPEGLSAALPGPGAKGAAHKSPVDAEATYVERRLKIFASGLPYWASDDQVLHHFQRYGQTAEFNLVRPPPKGGKGGIDKGPYAFVTFKFAADVDAAMLDGSAFPGCPTPLLMR